MERRHQERAPVLVEPSPQRGDRRLAPQERPRREGAERDDHLRADDLDLPEQESLAGRDLLRLRVAVPGRTALDDVRDVDLLAAELAAADDHRLDHLRQELARPPDERQSLGVLVGPGPLADEHQRRRRVPRSEHDRVAPAARACTGCIPRVPRASAAPGSAAGSPSPAGTTAPPNSASCRTGFTTSSRLPARGRGPRRSPGAPERRRARPAGWAPVRGSTAGAGPGRSRSSATPSSASALRCAAASARIVFGFSATVPPRAGGPPAPSARRAAAASGRALAHRLLSRPVRLRGRRAPRSVAFRPVAPAFAPGPAARPVPGSSPCTSVTSRSAISPFEARDRRTGAPLRPEERHGIRRHIEARPRGGDVVRHDEIEVLLAQLRPRARRRVPGLGGEAHEELPRPFPPPRLGEDVLRRDPADLAAGPRAWASLRAATFSGRKSATAAAIQSASQRARRPQDRLGHLRGRLDLDALDAIRGRQLASGRSRASPARPAARAPRRPRTPSARTSGCSRTGPGRSPPASGPPSRGPGALRGSVRGAPGRAPGRR